LRDDPNFDALVAAIYPDLDKYEEEVGGQKGTSRMKCILVDKYVPQVPLSI
jgi:hypothetical protein